MSKYQKMINAMVSLYQKNILFAFLFVLISIGILGLLFCIPIPHVRAILVGIWWLSSYAVIVDSLTKYKYGNKGSKSK